MGQWGWKDSYTEADVKSAWSYHGNKEEFAPISFWLDSLREKTIAEMKTSAVVKDSTLMAVNVGRLNAFNEIRNVILAARNNLFIQSQESPKTSSPLDQLSPEARAYAQDNGIIPMQQDNAVADTK